MKITKLTQHFRATKKDVDGKKVEQKRDSVEYSVSLLESADLPSLLETSPDALVTVLNDSLIAYAKKLFGQNSNDWDFIPSVEAVTIQAIADDLNAPRINAKVLSKANLDELAAFYRDIAAPAIGKSESASRNGALLIQDKLNKVLSKPAAVDSFIAAFNEIVTDEAIMEQASETVMLVLMALLDMLTASKEVKQIDLNDI